MYFEKKFQETVPTWSGKRGIPGVILPKYEPINLPVKKTNYFISGSIGTGKTEFVKKLIRYRLEEKPDLRLAILQVKPHDFDEFIADKGLFICQNPESYPQKRVFKWNAMKEFRSGGIENYFQSIQEFTSIAASEFHKSAGANLYFVDTAQETVDRYFLALLHSTHENIPNDRTFGFLENEEPKRILKVIANYRPNHNFLKIHFDFDPANHDTYTLTKRGRDIFIFISKIARVLRGNFREKGEDTIWEFLHSSRKDDITRLCICHEEGTQQSYVMEQYFLKRITNLMLGAEATISGDLLFVLDEVDKTRVKDFPLSKLATLGRDVNGKRTQMILSTQSFESLFAVAEDGNEHDTRALLAGFPIIASFNPGMDATTRNILKAAYGNHFVQKINTPLSRYDHLSVETKEEPMVKDEDFSSLAVGQMYLKIESECPYRIQLRE